MTDREKKIIVEMQKAEITEHLVYKKLAEMTDKKENALILERISNEEMEHYQILKKITGEDVSPSSFNVFIYVKIASIFGLNFGLKLMEGGESKSAETYSFLKEFPQAKKMMEDEKEHEKRIISMIDESILTYVSSVVLGLNDALVELTGALTGFTLALQNSRLVAMAGLITGIAASMSMGVSNYLSVKHESEGEKKPLKSAFYTFVSYIGTVIVLIAPYFVIGNIYVSLGTALIFAILIIAFFNFYVSVAKGLNFKERFLEMALLSLGVSAINYVIGILVRKYLHIDI